MRRFLALALLTAFGASGFALRFVHAAPVGTDTVGAQDISPEPRGNPLWAIPLTTLTTTGERPIFAPSRRRPTPPAVPAPVATAVPEPVAVAPEQISLKLLGTITSPKNGIAICFNQATGEIVRVRTGENFEGWVLRDVQAREVIFEKASQRTTLALPSPDDPQVASAPPQPPPSAAQPSPLPAAPSPQQPAAAANAKDGETWVDGDGNMIAPPKR